MTLPTLTVKSDEDKNEPKRYDFQGWRRMLKLSLISIHKSGKNDSAE